MQCCLKGQDPKKALDEIVPEALLQLEKSIAQLKNKGAEEQVKQHLIELKSKVSNIHKKYDDLFSKKAISPLDVAAIFSSSLTKIFHIDFGEAFHPSATTREKTKSAIKKAGPHILQMAIMALIIDHGVMSLGKGAVAMHNAAHPQGVPFYDLTKDNVSQGFSEGWQKLKEVALMGNSRDDFMGMVQEALKVAHKNDHDCTDFEYLTQHANIPPDLFGLKFFSFLEEKLLGSQYLKEGLLKFGQFSQEQQDNGNIGGNILSVLGAAEISAFTNTV